MSLGQKQFEISVKAHAEAALNDLSEKERVHFALKMLLAVRDTANAGAVRLASNRIREHADILSREAFYAECG